jgi:hypothetical protein
MDQPDTNAAEGGDQAELPVESFTVKISALNQEQLEQVFNMLRRQQEAVVAENQALGRAIDELKAKKAETARHSDKLGRDMLVISNLMDPAKRKAALAAMGVTGGTIGDFLAPAARQDGTAAGVVLEASSRGVQGG